MSHLTVVNRSQLFAAATAMTALGLLAIPAPARAGPMFPLPLAPPCSQYVFVGDFVIREAGWQTFFSSTGPVAGGRAATVSDDNVTKYTGYVSGGGIQGRNVDFTINFDRPGMATIVDHYTGTVGDDALVHHGVAQGSGNSGSWDSTHPLGCSTPVAPPPGPNDQPVVLAPGVKDPPPHQLGPQSPPAQAVATVTGDVDIYDAPGGNGNKVGVLRSGRQVKLVGTFKPNDWCNVVLPELPAGSGWVWGTFLKL